MQETAHDRTTIPRLVCTQAHRREVELNEYNIINSVSFVTILTCYFPTLSTVGHYAEIIEAVYVTTGRGACYY